MANRIKHKVLGDVELIQTQDTMTMPTIMIEVIELAVLLIVVFFLFFKFRNYFPKHKRHLNPEE